MIRITFKGEEIGPWHGQLVGADGLDASACKVESTDYASMDGAAFGAARMGRREVRLSYALSDEPEEARARIYEVFEPKSKGELGIRTEDKDLVAEAYVGAVECDPWARPQTVEVTLVCPDPWLYARQERQFPYETISTGTGWTGTGWRVSNRGAPAGFVVVGLANGTVGYIATDKALDEGSYETQLCRHVRSPKGTGKLWADTAVADLAELKKRENS